MDNKKKGNNGFSKRTDKNRQPDSVLNDLDMQVEEILAVLDIDAQIPDGLIEKVIKKKEAISIEKPPRFDLSRYLQIAAVLAAAIFVGVILGKNANVNSFNQKHNRDSQALMELRQKHHLSESNSFGRF